MRKAEERARETYPIEDCYDEMATGKRIGFIEGYEQAIKDLALTWEDIRCIVKIADQIVDEDRRKFMAMEDEDYYKEVLARYVKQSEKP